MNSFEFKKILKNAQEKLNKEEFLSKEVYHKFIDENDNFIIFGASNGGINAKKLLEEKNKKIKYFLDNDIKKSGTLIDNLIVKHPSEVKFIDGKIIIASSWWFDIAYQVKETYNLSFLRDYSVMPLELCGLTEIGYQNAYRSFLNEINKNTDMFLKTIDAFQDEQSKELYIMVIKYRLFYLMIDYFNKNEIPFSSFPQYLHPLVKPQDNDIIVDAGAYIGDTIEQIIQKGVNYKKIYAFEPDEQNYTKLIENTKTYQNIETYKYGLWDKTDKLYFSAEANMGSSITTDISKSSQTIDTLNLDEFFKDKEKPTLIKMDIEGAELNALLGAKDIITKYKPKLQICIYHKPEHLWQIPLLIKELVPEYKLYLGHHASTLFETVLYAKV